MDPPHPATAVVLLRDGAEVGAWPIELGDGLDLALIDRVARMQLCACRVGAVVRIRNAPPAFGGLLHLVGLGALVECSVEAGGQPEDREQRDVHEAVMPRDSAG